MKMSEIQNKSDKELAKDLKEYRKELQDIRFGNAGSKSNKIRQRKAIKKDIARILTVVSEHTIHSNE